MNKDLFKWIGNVKVKPAVSLKLAKNQSEEHAEYGYTAQSTCNEIKNYRANLAVFFFIANSQLITLKDIFIL